MAIEDISERSLGQSRAAQGRYHRRAF